MSYIKRVILFPVVGILFVWLLISCGEKSDKMLILDLMDKAGAFIEQKDARNLMVFIAEDYSDFKGRNKSETEEMVRQYFLDYQGIVTHILSTKIDDIA
ncbi:MAG: hypothetical protein PVF66_09580, partial [Candidatus Aminicenantes bacterium]